MNNYRYEIDSENAVRLWDDANPNPENEPFFYQPDWPNGEPWASKAEAKAWAQLFIESLENPESEFVPGESPDEPRKPRPIVFESESPEIESLDLQQ